MITRRSALSVLAGSAFVFTSQAASPKTLSGTVVYREKMALPVGAVLFVKLEDVSLADAPAKVLAESRQTIQGAPPLSYTLRVPGLERGRQYSLHAEIRAGDEILFTTTEMHSVSEPDILVTRVSAPATELPYGSWTVQSLNGKAIPKTGRPPQLTIGRDGRVFGYGGCNRLMGQAEIVDHAIKFKSFAMTRMACIGSGMVFENLLVKTLDGIRFWSRDEAGRLILHSDNEAQVIVLHSE